MSTREGNCGLRIADCELRIMCQYAGQNRDWLIEAGNRLGVGVRKICLSIRNPQLKIRN
jgi:hypothetical protein